MEQKPGQPFRFTWKTIAIFSVITAVTIILSGLLANVVGASNPGLWTSVGAGLGALIGFFVVNKVANRQDG